MPANQKPIAAPPSASRIYRPALRSLETFESAARLGSFGAAAREIRMTPSAISHQIASLESLLGVQLFARVGRGVKLTEHGLRYLEKVQKIIRAVDEATREIVGSAATEVVKIHTPPSIASKWLLPLLPSFLSANPEIEVRVSAEAGRAGFSWDYADLAILYQPSYDIEENSLLLFEERIQPLCSPLLLQSQPMRQPSDVLNHVLIHTNYNAVKWKDWFALHGVRGFSTHRKIQIDPSHVAIEAATKDFGVVLESDILSRDELSSGKLVAPLGQFSVKGGTYALAWSPAGSMSASMKMLRDWLCSCV